MMFQSIDCTHARDLIIGALENEPLTESERAKLDAHLAECAGCRSYRQTMQHLAISLKAIPQVPAPAGLSERIMAQLAKEAPPAAESAPIPPASGGSTPVLLSRWRRYSPIAAAVLVIAMAVPLAFFSMRQGPYTGQEIARKTNTPPLHTTQQPPADDFNMPYADNGMGQADFPVTRNGENGFNTPEHQTYGQNNMNPPHQSIAQSGGSGAGSPQGWSGGSGANASSGNTGSAARNAADTPATELLAAADPSASMSSAVSGETESDLYYDPVSDLVGF